MRRLTWNTPFLSLWLAGYFGLIALVLILFVPATSSIAFDWFIWVTPFATAGLALNGVRRRLECIKPVTDLRVLGRFVVVGLIVACFCLFVWTTLTIGIWGGGLRLQAIGYGLIYTPIYAAKGWHLAVLASALLGAVAILMLLKSAPRKAALTPLDPA